LGILRASLPAEKIGLLIFAMPMKAGFCSWLEALEMDCSAFFKMLEAVILCERIER
jgi:hypothetical protein